MVAHSFNPSTWEAESRGSQDHPGLHHEFEASLGNFVIHWLKKNIFLLSSVQGILFPASSTAFVVACFLDNYHSEWSEIESQGHFDLHLPFVLLLRTVGEEGKQRG
jgi:hypothetical protein